MRVPMLPQMISPCETLGASLTNISFPPRMGIYVWSQISFVVKLFRAELALVGFLGGTMFGVMCFKNYFVGEAFAASVAAKGLFAVVECFIVLRKITNFGKYLVTFVATNFAGRCS